MLCSLFLPLQEYRADVVEPGSESILYGDKHLQRMKLARLGSSGSPGS